MPTLFDVFADHGIDPLSAYNAGPPFGRVRRAKKRRQKKKNLKASWRAFYALGIVRHQSKIYYVRPKSAWLGERA